MGRPSERENKGCVLTLKTPITTAADDNFRDIFLNFLPSDDSHEISDLISYF